MSRSQDPGHERLAESGDLDRATRAFVDHYEAFARDAGAGMVETDRRAWTARLLHEHDNVRKAVALSASSVDGGRKGIAIAGALQSFWVSQGLMGQARELATLLLSSPHAREPNQGRQSLLQTSAFLAEHQGGYETARFQYEEALAIARECGAKTSIGRLLPALGHVLQVLGQHERAAACFGEAIPLARELADRATEGNCLMSLSLVSYSSGDAATARSRAMQALAVFRETGDRAATAAALSNLGVFERFLGNWTAARAYSGECLAIREEMGDRRAMIRTQVNIAMIDYDTGDLDAARRSMEKALPWCEEVGDREPTGTICNNLGVIAEKQGAPADARRYIVRALKEARAMGDKFLMLNVIENCARIEIARGHAERAAYVIGATDRYRSERGIAREASDAADQEKAMARLQDTLGPEVLRDTMAAGHHMTLEAAADFSLKEPGDP